MAANDELNGSDQLTNESARGATNGIPAEMPFGAGTGQPRSPWVMLALRNRRRLIYAGLAGMAAAFILTKFVMHKKYQAQAMIRPAASQDQNSLGGLLQSTGLLQNSSSLNTGPSAPPDPNELEAILESYAFTTAMAEQEHLAPKLLKGARSLTSWIPFIKHAPPDPYSLYLLMSARFKCDFSLRTGNMSLSYIDKDPELARTILGLYVDRLRDQVRNQTVRDTKAALRSLEQEADKSLDPMLRDQLYELVAFQMQQVKTAEANADFAFTVLEPAWVSPIPYAPWVLLDTVAGGIVAFVLMYIGLALFDVLPRVRKGISDLEAEADRTRRDLPMRRSERPRNVPTPESDRPYTL
jgi:hypothetical protein